MNTYARFFSVGRATALVAALATVAACGRQEGQGADSANANAADTAAKAPEPAPEAPATFRVRFETSKGPFTVEVMRAWAPLGADRFHQLVKSGYFDNTRFFRVVPGFIVQFGMHGDPEVNKVWENLMMPDDSVTQSNRRGTIVYATSGPNTRSNQFFVNLADNRQLDDMGFAPFGRVLEGMSVVDALYSAYGEQPVQGQIRAEGNAYLEREFPRLDFVRTARLVEQEGVAAPPADSAR